MTERDATPSPRDRVADQLFELFRWGGFEGVSLGDIAKATALGRSSLYHHFPGGKEEMAEAVMDRAAAWTDAHLLAPLRQDAPRAVRVDAMLAAARRLYDDGRAPCIVAAMRRGPAPAPVCRRAHTLLASWVETLEAALVATDAAPTAAQAAAVDAVIRIQGALIVAGALADPTLFPRALETVRENLLAA